MTTVRFRGTCRIFLCMDVARSIELRSAEHLLAACRRGRLQHKGSIHLEGGGVTPPLRFAWAAQELRIGEWTPAREVDVSLYDIGTIGVTWSLAFESTLEELVQLAVLLYGNEPLIAASRSVADEVGATLGNALERPKAPVHIEDYVMFQVPGVEGEPGALLAAAGPSVARMLRAEPGELSSQEIGDALAGRVSYGPRDTCLVDWNACLLLGEDTEDERQVLELATVGLLELRELDVHLGREIGVAYELVARRRAPGSFAAQRRELEQVARMQADDAMLHEGIDNALKIFGDDYLARLHRTAAERFHFHEWEISIERKLGVLSNVYGRLADLAAHRRAELLEWIIIFLIAGEIVLAFSPLRR